MAGVGSVTGLYQPTVSEQQNIASNNFAIEMSDFYELLAAQMQYQDPNNPMDTAELMSSLLQSQVIQSIAQVTDAVTQMQYASATTYAASLQGMSVKIAEVDEYGMMTGEFLEGEVTGVILGTNPMVIVDGETYPLSQIVGVGEVSDEILSGEEEEETGTGETENGTEDNVKPEESV